METRLKLRIRVRCDETGQIEWPADECAKLFDIHHETPALEIQKDADLPREHQLHEIGKYCPHCGGTGSYLIHRRRVIEKCYRCDGKGILDEFDMAFLELRRRRGATVNCIYGGPAVSKLTE